MHKQNLYIYVLNSNLLFTHSSFNEFPKDISRNTIQQYMKWTTSTIKRLAIDGISSRTNVMIQSESKRPKRRW